MADLTHFHLLAAAMRSRDVWDEYEAAGESKNAPEDLLPVVDAVRDFYAADSEATSASHDLVLVKLLAGTRDPKRMEALKRIMENLHAAKVSVPNAREAARSLRRRRTAEALATSLLIPSKDGKATLDALLAEYLELDSTSPDDDGPQWTAGVLAPKVGDPRVPIFPRVLGDRLRGGLWPGHHMTVFARPEIGKTAFALNAAVMAASRGQANVLYLSNEDSVRDLMLRTLVRFTNKSQEEVLSNLDGALEVARRYGADRIRFGDMAPGSLAEVERMVRKYRPDLLVVDQMRNMGGAKNENMTQRLDSVAQGLRNIGKRHECAVISVTQAGDSARDKAILDDGDVDNSNTGIAAGCDVLIGIGATQVMRDAGERRLSIIKNKLGGTHGYADVRLDPMTLAFRDKQ